MPNDENGAQPSLPDILTESVEAQENSEGTPQVSEPVSAQPVVLEKLSKNARKKARRENALPRDPIFGETPKGTQQSSQQSSKPQGKPARFDVKEHVKQAKQHAQLANGLVNKYFEVRGAVMAVANGNSVEFHPMTCERLGEIVYYVDKSSGGFLRGSIGEALCFHASVAGDGSMGWLDQFIEKHRSGVSIFAMVAVMGYIEVTLKKNAMIYEAVLKRQGAVSDETPQSPANTVENPSIEVEAVPL